MSKHHPELTLARLRALLNALPPAADRCLVIVNDGEYYVSGVEWDGESEWAGTGRYAGPKVNLLTD